MVPATLGVVAIARTNEGEKEKEKEEKSIYTS
jgi:hypothetical protein